MSLLEDVFLEDEAGEAQELERVIEGGDYDDIPQSPNSDDNEEKEDEAEEDKRRIDPQKPKSVRVVKNPRCILNPARLTGPRGIHVIQDHFKDFKFKGNGYEKEDLDMVLKKLEHWAYRLYPKFGFKDCLKKIEMLGKKRPVMVNLIKIRSDQFTSEETVVQKDSSDDEAPTEEVDEFDKLLQQQIELARSTPAPGSMKKTTCIPSVERSMSMPKATSSPSISEEQRDRMLRNRKLAEERRFSKIKNDNSNENNNFSKQSTLIIEGISEIKDEVVTRRKTISNVIDSSDDEEMIVNQPVTADIHNGSVEIDKAQTENVSDDVIGLDKKAISLTSNGQRKNIDVQSDSIEFNQVSAINVIRVLENHVVEINDEIRNDLIVDNINNISNVYLPENINDVNGKNVQDEVADSEIDSISVTNKENLDNNTEEIMNMDFSDEF